MKQNRMTRSGGLAAAGTYLAGAFLVRLPQSTAEARPAGDLRRRRRAFGWCVIGLLVWGASGAWAGDGVVALQTAAASCADPTNADRYIDCANGTVTDNDTGLVWLKNANCIGAAGGGTGDPEGRVDWFTAMEFVAGLSDLQGNDPDDCGLEDGSSPGEWRLASKAEWQAMTTPRAGDFMGCSSPAITNDAGGDCWDTICVAAGSCSFVGLVSAFYWSASTLVSFPGNALVVTLVNGFVSNGGKTFGNYVWPVRGGQ